ncbi:MAG: outer membrane beta-barrel protein [Acidobacteriota bacterium]|nr:outer membrane beta-barrel protein [Acidobacteriota bacterium]
MNKPLTGRLTPVAAALGLLAALVVALPNAALAQGWTGNVNALVGAKELDKNDWEPLESQDEVGILVDFKRAGWPVSIAVDFLRSDAKETMIDPASGLAATIEGETQEFDVGIRKIWDRSAKARPYIGGGLALISAEISAEVLGVRVSAKDDAQGAWIGGGVYWTLGKAFNLGFDVRYSQADVKFLGVDGDAGGTHAGLLLGFHW